MGSINMQNYFAVKVVKVRASKMPHVSHLLSKSRVPAIFLMKQNLPTKCWNNTLRRTISQKGLKGQKQRYELCQSQQKRISNIFSVDNVKGHSFCMKMFGPVSTRWALSLGELSVKCCVWSSPHAPQHLKEDQIPSVQNWDDNEEDSHQKAEEEHHGLDDHACRRKIRAAGICWRS